MAQTLELTIKTAQFRIRWYWLVIVDCLQIIIPISYLKLIKNVQLLQSASKQRQDEYRNHVAYRVGQKRIHSCMLT